jgi:hypothetical protein
MTPIERIAARVAVFLGGAMLMALERFRRSESSAKHSARLFARLPL